MVATVLTATANDIVRAALRLIGEVDANQTVGATEIQDGLESLNYLVKGWQSQSLHLWTKREATLFLDVGKENYKLGPSGDEVTDSDDFTNTELAVAGDDTLTMNGTTTGGLIGSWVQFTDVTAALWMVNGFLASSGTEATVFSAAV